jgi:phage terminase large subunit-like protein
LERFERFCRAACGFELEDFQRRIMREVFDGRRSLLVLIPRGNGKTTLFAALALYHMLTTPAPQAFIAASSIGQADVAYEIASTFVLESPRLKKEIRTLPGYKMLRLRNRAGSMRCLSSDGDRAHGKIPSLALVDELHAHKNARLFEALKTAMGKRADAQMLTISTAGHDLGGVLGQWRERVMRLPDRVVDDRLTVVRNAPSNFAMFEWACRPDDDLSDPAVVKRANPASFVSEAFLAEQIASPELSPLEFARYHANVWTQVEDQWISPEAWVACLSDEDIPDGGEVYVGVDASKSNDATAVAWAWRSPDSDRVVVRTRIWSLLPQTPAHDYQSGPRIVFEPIEQHIRDLASRYRVAEVHYDPTYFIRSAEILSEEGLLMVEVDQRSAAMRRAYNEWYAAVAQERVAHDGDDKLRSHVMNVAASLDAYGDWHIRKLHPGARGHKIDGLVASVMAHAAAAPNTASVYEDRGLLTI